MKNGKLRVALVGVSFGAEIYTHLSETPGRRFFGVSRYE